VILDACRNNPFGGRGLRDAGGGLAEMKAPRGTVISYATQPGSVAIDGSGGHSPYTTALAEIIKKPGLPVLEVFNEVGVEVMDKTGGRQQPWISSSPLEGVFYFLGPTTVNIQPPPPPAPVKQDPEIVFWQSIEKSKTAADFEEYLKQYPKGQFAGLAHNRLAALKPPPRPTAPPVKRVVHRPPPRPREEVSGPVEPPAAAAPRPAPAPIAAPSPAAPSPTGRCFTFQNQQFCE
jgi:hypothetical protein